MELKDTVISLIVLTHNDSDIILSRILKLKRALTALKCNFEILVVDNNSTDETISEITSLKEVMRHTRILVLSKTYDEEVALTAGLDNCIGDFAILFSLYTDPVEIISLLTEKLTDGFNICIGKIRRSVAKKPFFEKALIRSAQRLSSSGWKYRQNYTMALDRKAINSITRTRRKSRNFSYINSLIGLKKTEIVYKPEKRYKNKMKREKPLPLLITIVDTVISNSFRPIRILSALGMAFSLLYILYVTVVVVLYLFFDQKQLIPKGWVTLSAVLGSMFFLLFSTLSVISEYLIRILTETRNEPFYFISEEISQSEILPKGRKLNIV
ncbi:MAG: Glycosyl transferase family 2 [Candidatus Woesebacteria bacterium GW2011_GWB1_45_5]|uniref:Glycosyl transferase family 2 n=1 Tax=Candidatus Woesebacteria bacterium GW2011_GWB1_45_5 TaxID=1618581 RepID=A0A0G1MRW4_9BACT|nr:MAG: Glycosyl transferase family 2 [Candidatus Woesebacteria bacterium GW2011_GWB1_45_5]